MPCMVRPKEHSHFAMFNKEGKDGASLYRVFYYDCPPSSKIIYHPLLKKTINLGKTEDYMWATEFFKELKHQQTMPKEPDISIVCDKNKITDKTTREQPVLYSTRCSPSSKFLVSSTIYTGRSFSSVKSMAIYSPMIPMRKNIMANIKQISTTMVA